MHGGSDLAGSGRYGTPNVEHIARISSRASGADELSTMINVVSIRFSRAVQQQQIR